ncbi:MAG TPA: hypothetical protein VK612_09790, partial [Pyrinomonadaceae bacterium]|nr:hypothetical protein [Pyrinomonadaceae bacterium]
RVLLSGIIDYAGLFPPSQVSMPEAVINYATYKNSNYGWMLGRFVVPVSRLDEFIESARELASRDAKGAWHLAVVAGDDIDDTIRRVEAFNNTYGPGVVCDVLEVKANTSSKIENTVAALPNGVTVYFEIATGEQLADLVSTIAIKGHRAKLRTGGVTPEAFPTSKQIIRFVRTCMAANVPFKATAGLHHPMRCFKPLAYTEDAPQGTMHGFLNVLLMTGFARESYRVSFLEELMEEEFEEVFQFSELGVKWRDEHTLTTAHLGWLRQKGMHSFGSCSFDEPIADLRVLGLL